MNTIFCDKMPYLRSFFLLFLYPIVGLPALHAADTAPPPALARVALFKFADNTGSAQYAWLATSLPGAVSISLHNRFEFADAPTEGVASPATEAEADASAIRLKGDILIYGDYQIVAGVLNVRATVYNAAAKKVIGRAEVKSPLNARIFGAVDRLASNIVGEIYKFALAEKGGKDGASSAALKVLVLVPSFANNFEERQAIREMDALKSELAATRPGKYLTIYEFFDENKVADDERARVIYFAKTRNRMAIVSWLKTYSVPDAFIVLVSAGRVNITPVAEGRAAAPVVYAVGATPAMKQAAIGRAVATQEAQAARLKPQEKIQLTQQTTAKNFMTLYLASVAAQSFILPSGGLGTMAGFDLHTAWHFSSWFEPHVALAGYYGLAKTDVLATGTFAGSVQAGLGKTFRGKQFSFVPYLVGGVFAGRLKPHSTLAITSGTAFLMPAAAGGFIVGYTLTQRVDIFIKAEAMYVVDGTPALIATGGLGVGVRF